MAVDHVCQRTKLLQFFLCEKCKVVDRAIVRLDHQSSDADPFFNGSFRDIFELYFLDQIAVSKDADRLLVEFDEFVPELQLVIEIG